MNIYFSGITGVGIGPLAQIARDLQWGVSGSDNSSKSNAITSNLEQSGCQILLGAQDCKFLSQIHAQTPIDYFVYTSALPTDHPELKLAKELGIPTIKRNSLLNIILEQTGQQLVAIAGTHGKTTTTAMIVWIARELGARVSYSIGTTIDFGPSGRYNPNAKYLVYEADEYDRNFLAFWPQISAITAVDFDHSDIFPTQMNYDQAFLDFIEQSQSVILWDERFYQSYTSKLGDKCQVLSTSGDEIEQIELSGRHNRQNALLALKTFQVMSPGEYSFEQLAEVLSSFPSSGRRFQRLSSGIISDYAHTPEEIRASLQQARELAQDKQILAVYQPHQNSRQHQVLESGGYGDAFAIADEVIWLPTYLTREDPAQETLTPDNLINSLDQSSQTKARSSVLRPELLNELLSRAKDDNTLVLAMGAGTIHDWLTDQEETAE